MAKLDGGFKRAVARLTAACPCTVRAVMVLILAAMLAWAISAPPVSAKRRAPPWQAIPPESWKEPARPDSGGGDALILVQRIEDWDLKGEIRRRVFRRIRVFTAEGRDAGRVEVGYSKSAKIENMRARSIRQDGTTTELSPDQVIHTTLVKRSGLEWNMKSFIVPGIEPGCIIEYEYTMKGKYRGNWHSTAYFQNDLYTCVADYRWSPSEWIVDRLRPAKWEFHRILPFQVVVETKPDSVKPRVVTFRTWSVPGLKAEPFAPPIADAGSRVVTYYGPGQNWSFAKRAMEVVGERYMGDLGPLEEVVADARTRTRDPLQALAIVHRWLQTHVRAISELSWQERQGGPWRPRIEALEGRFEDPRLPGWPIIVWQWVVGPVNQNSPVTSLVEHGWGTPYEINAAFVSAARRLDLEACVAFVGDRRDEPFDGRPGSPWPSDVVSAVRTRRGGWAFYDPASAFSPVGSIPWFLRGGKALLGGEGSDLLVPLHAEDGLPARTRWDLDLTLDGSGDLDGRVSEACWAEASRELKSWLWSIDPDLWKDRLQEKFAGGGTPKLEFDHPHLGIDPDSTFVLAGRIHYGVHAPPVGRIMTLPLDGLIPWRYHADFGGLHRNQPLFFQDRIEQTILITIHLPAGAAAAHLPTPRTFENGLGTFRTSWERTSDGVRYIRSVQLRYVELDRRDYDVVRAFFDALAVADGDVLLVELS